MSAAGAELAALTMAEIVSAGLVEVAVKVGMVETPGLLE